MRQDLGKCIIEAPRSGSRNACSAKARHYGRITLTEDGYDYDGFTRFPVSRKQEGYNKYLGYKSFSDKLGPLRGYLQANCGRPWNDVYSEIAYHLGRFTKAEGIRHIISAHLSVATNTWRGESGKVYNDGKHGPEEVSSGWRTEFYIEPETGILRESPRHKIPKRKKEETPDRISIDNDSEYRKLNNVWYYQKVSRTADRRYKGTVRGRAVFEDVEIELVIEKRQLGKKELKRLCLKGA